MQVNVLFSGKIYIAGKTFTRLMVAEVATNFNSDSDLCSWEVYVVEAFISLQKWTLFTCKVK